MATKQQTAAELYEVARKAQTAAKQAEKAEYEKFGRKVAERLAPEAKGSTASVADATAALEGVLAKVAHCEAGHPDADGTVEGDSPETVEADSTDTVGADPGQTVEGEEAQGEVADSDLFGGDGDDANDAQRRW